jgi:hypothetical protein
MGCGASGRLVTGLGLGLGIEAGERRTERHGLKSSSR